MEKAQKVNINGFYLYSHDNDGKCFIRDESKIMNHNSKKLLFGEGIQLSCSLALTAATLKDYCENTAAKFNTY